MVKSSTKSSRNSKISKRDVKDAIVNRSNSVSSLLNSKHVSIQEIKPDSRSTRRRKSPSINLVELQLKKQSLDKRREATRKIRRNLKNVRGTLIPKIRARFLNAICSDAGVCVAFGKERETIRRHFNDFANFEYATSRAKRIGKVSANGFVIDIPYERDGYMANAVLKSSMTNHSDNLLYEFAVGVRLNDIGAYVPCLIETYGLFRYKSEAKWEEASKKSVYRNMGKYVTELNLPMDTMVKLSCKYPTRICVLVQHLKNVKTIGDVIVNDLPFPEYEMLTSLFQIYFFLSMYRDVFTHYDLHTDNVLLYKPVDGKYIEYIYYLNEYDTFTFYSCVIPKIIDYGRCHISESSGFLSYLCNEPACDPNCGVNVGYEYFDPAPPEHAFGNISLEHPNVSHDLRLYNTIRRFYNKPLIKELKQCVYTGEYGTPPVQENSSNPNLIKNVTDCFLHILDVLKKIPVPEPPTRDTVLATMHVYGNKPMDVIYY